MPTIIAEAIVQTGYGTSHYNPDTGECEYEHYASITEVISGKTYWDQYETIMSIPLLNDFDLDSGFATYRLTVLSDGQKTAKLLN